MDGLYLRGGGGGGGGGRKGQGEKGGSILTNDTFAGESQAEENHSELPLRLTMTSLLALLILSTLVGNTLVCVAVVRFRHLRSKVTNVFIVSLAVSDLLVAVLVMPWKAAAEAAGFWPFGRFCDLWLALDITCSTASILNLCVISVDRYWAISRPFAYERTMTRKTALMMVGAAWVLSALISFMPVQLRWHRASPADDPGGRADANVTGTPEENCDSRLNRTYAISSSLVSFYIPVAIMVGTYARIFCIAQRQIRRISSLERAAEHTQGCQSRGCPHEIPSKNSFRKETKVLKTLSVIVGVFVFCWLPFFVLNCVAPFCDRASQEHGGLPCVGDTVFDIFVWFGWANSSLNPIIYAFNADFRKAFASLLGCGGFCPSNAVEAVDFTNELVSYHHDTSCQKELATLSYPHLLPRTAAIRGEDDVLGFDKDSQSSSDYNTAVLPTIVNVEDEVDLAHEKIRPFAPHTVD